MAHVANGIPIRKMSPNTGNRPAAHAVNGILQERSPNVPATVTRTSNRSTPSTLSLSGNNHVHFDEELMGRTERTSLLALAYMPPPDSDDDEAIRPRRSPRLLPTVEEEERDHELEQLANYEGDSDDDGEDAAFVMRHVNEREGEFEPAVVVDEAYTACDDLLTQEEMHNQQNKANAPLILEGAPPGWKAPCAPEGWKPAKPKTNLGEPIVKFEDIDNPGGWSQFTFRPKFLWKDRKCVKYLHYALPTDAIPVPEGDNGKREVNGFDFHYNGWTRDESDTPFRSGATRDNMFPESRKGCLDVDVLKKLGMSVDRMKKAKYDEAPDALFFWQLLFPIHDTRNGGTMDGDPRMPYYPHVAECTELYAITDLKLRGSGRGHRFKETSPQELVKWDGVVVFDGVLGGSKGAILRRWDIRRPDNSSFNKHIYDSMTLNRWLEIKRAIKLNNNMLATKRGDDNHDPAQKYDYIWKVLCHNTNVLTKKASLDLCGDETTWIFAGWAEPGSGIIKGRLEKPGGSKGGQTVVVTDCDRIRLRAYVHRHKLHTKHFSHEGCNEIKMITDQLLSMLEPTEVDLQNINRPKAIFQEKFHMTWDNYFSGDSTMNYIAEKGLGITLTVNRGRLPSGVPAKYLHRKRVDPDERTKAARFENPIVAIKRDPTKWNNNSVWQHTSFQSTSSCNIAHVNAINACSLYAAQKQRGRKLFKRSWAIEMNESRQLYLATYGKVDRIDHMVKNCNLYYRSWKYWHAPMTLAKGWGIATAYDIYIECAEGNLDPSWKQDNPCDFHRFREMLGVQMLKYDPTKREYPGDEKFRVSTQQNQEQRRRSTQTRAQSPAASTSSGVAEDDYTEATNESNRFCGFLDTLISHRDSVARYPGNNGRVCVVCGNKTAKHCGKCSKPMHMHQPDNAEDTKTSCFIHYHNTGFFGLARDDCKIVRRRQRDWTFPTTQQRKLNTAEMKKIHNNKVNRDLNMTENVDNGDTNSSDMT